MKDNFDRSKTVVDNLEVQRGYPEKYFGELTKCNSAFENNEKSMLDNGQVALRDLENIIGTYLIKKYS